MSAAVDSPSPDRSEPNESVEMDAARQPVYPDDDGAGWHPTLGGTIDTPCFALLAGIFLDPQGDTDRRRIVQIPVTHLPATLGRSHDTKDSSFFGLGDPRALSRQQCRISFVTDVYGGRLGQYHESSAPEQLVYRPPPQKRVKLEVIGERPSSHGFFAIECLGKNRIMVDEERVEQGQMAVLRDGSKIRISTFCLHFLLPSSTMANTIIQVPNPDYRKSHPLPAQRSKRVTKKIDISNSSTQELLDAFFEAVEAGQYESRQTKLINGELILRAVGEAAKDEGIRQEQSSMGNISRGDIVDWIEKSDVFGVLAEELMSIIDMRSYQVKVGNYMVKAGYTRDPATSGSKLRWFLPSSDDDEDAADDAEGSDQEPVSEDDGQVENDKVSKKAPNKIADVSVLSTQELLEAFFEAIESDHWDMKQTKQISRELTHRAVLEAATDDGIRQKESEKGNVPRSLILEFIEDSDVFGAFVEETLSRVEMATFQAKVRESMIKVGFLQDPATSGGHMRWFLPRPHAGEDMELARADENVPAKDSNKPGYEPGGVAAGRVGADSDGHGQADGTAEGNKKQSETPYGAVKGGQEHGD